MNSVLLVTDKSYVFLRTREHSTRLMETNELRYTLWVQPIRVR